MKNIKKVLLALLIFGLGYSILDALFTDGIKNTYCLSDDKCVTVWKRENGEAYIIFGKHKGQKTPSDNYIQTTNDNAITMIYEGDKEYDYVIFNNYGKAMDINMENSKVKYYHYEKSEEFRNKYYGAKSTNPQYKNHGARFIKPQYKYFTIDIKENLVIIDGVKR